MTPLTIDADWSSDADEEGDGLREASAGSRTDTDGYGASARASTPPQRWPQLGGDENDDALLAEGLASRHVLDLAEAAMGCKQSS